jgi:hypothetical protein
VTSIVSRPIRPSGHDTQRTPVGYLGNSLDGAGIGHDDHFVPDRLDFVGRDARLLS